MNSHADVTTESKLKQSRTELRHLFDDDDALSADEFPRSKTMRLLTGSPGVVLAAVIAGGVLLMRPQLAKQAFRMVPASAVLRALAMRFLR